MFWIRLDTERTDASKIALVHLTARLIAGGFNLLDTQFVTDHLKQFGTIELDRAQFQTRLEAALKTNADFNAMPLTAAPEQIVATVLHRPSAHA